MTRRHCPPPTATPPPPRTTPHRQKKSATFASRSFPFVCFLATFLRRADPAQFVQPFSFRSAFTEASELTLDFGKAGRERAKTGCALLHTLLPGRFRPLPPRPTNGGRSRFLRFEVTATPPVKRGRRSGLARGGDKNVGHDARRANQACREAERETRARSIGGRRRQGGTLGCVLASRGALFSRRGLSRCAFC